MARRLSKEEESKKKLIKDLSINRPKRSVRDSLDDMKYVAGREASYIKNVTDPLESRMDIKKSQAKRVARNTNANIKSSTNDPGEKVMGVGKKKSTTAKKAAKSTTKAPNKKLTTYAPNKKLTTKKIK